MNRLSSEARDLIRAARDASEPSAATVARVRDAIQSRIAAGDVVDASKAPPPNTAAAIARGALSKWLGVAMVAMAMGGAGAAGRGDSATATRTRAASLSPARGGEARAADEPGGVEGQREAGAWVLGASGTDTRTATFTGGAWSGPEVVASRARTRVGVPARSARRSRTVSGVVVRREEESRASIGIGNGIGIGIGNGIGNGVGIGQTGGVEAASVLGADVSARVVYLAGDDGDARSAQRTAQHADANAVITPSDAMANALRLYAQDRWAESATQFQRVVEGGTPDDPATVQRAQFHLARALEHLGLHQAALDVFDEIVQRGAEHPYFGATLPWLAALSRALPEPAGLARRVGAYDESYLTAFDHDDTRDLHDELLYLRARAHYDEAQLDPAIALFRRIRPGSRYYVRARFFQGVASVRSHRAQPAAEAFREVLGAIERGVPNIEEHERMSDLAWLELARLYYATGHFASAIEAWDRIHVESEYWLDAEFEEAWAYMLTQDYPRALGNIHTLNGPYFERAWYPESLVLRGVIQFTNCQYDDAETAVAEFQSRYGSKREALEHYLDAHDGSERAAELVRDARDAEHRMPAALVPLANAAVGDRTVRRYLEYVDRIDAEQALLQSLPRELRDSSLGARILAGDAVARSFALDGAADLVRQRYRRAADELRDLQNQATSISIEILDARRGEFALEAQGVHIPPGGAHQPQIVAVDQLEDGLLWPFDGEYWRDEQGTYRQRVQSRCSR